MTKSRTLRILMILWWLALVLGLAGLTTRLLTGERLVGYGSYVSWGLWVALYFHAVGIAGGVFAVGVAGYLFRIPGLREHLRVTLWVSAAALLTGLLAIGLDLGRPSRALSIIWSPRFTSMMAFNAWMYGLFLATAAACFALSYRRPTARALNDRSGWLVPLLLLGLAMAVAFPSQSGVFFGVVEAKPYWSTALMPMLFLAAAVASGAAVLLLVHTFLLREDAGVAVEPLRLLRRVAISTVAVYFAFEFAEISIAMWPPASHAREEIELVLFGPFWWVFWLVHLGGGLAALVLLAGGRSLPTVGTGAFLVALTFVSARLNVLVPGQSIPELRGLQEAFSHARLSFRYGATPAEYLVALFIGAVGVGLIYLGLRLLGGPTFARGKVP